MNDKIKYPEMRGEVLTALRSLSDIEHQRTRWGRSYDDYYGDLDLNIHVLYDDTSVLEDPDLTVGSIVYSNEVPLLRALDEVLNPILDEVGDRPDSDYINHAKWATVLNAAAQAVQMFEENNKS